MIQQELYWNSKRLQLPPDARASLRTPPELVILGPYVELD
jgi:hypothetical protein